jgi:uncharacterized protein (UPF0147 family)
MGNGKNDAPIKRTGSGAKSETGIVPDKETRARIYEEHDIRAREDLAKIEATSALTDELLRQMFADLKKSRPQIESDPKLLLLPLQVVKVLFDATEETLNLRRDQLQSYLKLAEEISLHAEAENDPEMKSHYRGVSDRIRATVASDSEKLRELEMKQQLRSQEKDSILADINELIASLAPKPPDDPK